MRHGGSGEHHHNSRESELDTMGAGQVSAQTGQTRLQSTELHHDICLQMTLEVAAGYEECFFVDNVKTGQAIDFEFQVGNYFSTDTIFDKIINCLPRLQGAARRLGTMTSQ